MDDVLLPVMDAWLSARTTAEVTELLMAAGVPTGDVKSPAEVLADEQAQLRGMLLTIPTYAGIDVITAASPIPWDGERRAQHPIPAAGEHTETVLRDLLGYDDDAIHALIESGTVAMLVVQGLRPGDVAVEPSGSFGRPSTRSPRMLRCTSDVPPAIVFDARAGTTTRCSATSGRRRATPDRPDPRGRRRGSAGVACAR